MSTPQCHEINVMTFDAECHEICFVGRKTNVMTLMSWDLENVMRFIFSGTGQVFSTQKKPTNDDVFMHSGKQKCNNSPENLMICNSHDKISILRLAFSHGSVIRILNLTFIIFALRICHLAFYPRPVLAFGYCLACVCPSVSPSVCHQVCPRDNSSPVQARITKFGPLV